MRRLIALLILIADSAAAGDAAILTQVNTRRDVPVDFVELRMNRLLREPLELTGVLVYASDGALTKEITSPIRESLTLSDTYLEVSRDGRSRKLRLNRMPDVTELYAVLRALLDGDADAIEASFAVTSQQTGESWSATLVPHGMPLAGIVTEMSVSGRGSRLLRIHIEQPGGSWQTLTITESQAL